MIREHQECSKGSTSLRVVGHVVAKDENPFFFGVACKKTLSTGSNKCTEKANLFAPHYRSDCNFLLSSTLKLTLLRSYKSVQVGFTRC